MLAPWAEEEMAAVDLGDERLEARAALLLSALGGRPNLSIPAACGGRAEMAAAYRFFDHEQVPFGQVLRPHADRTRERVAAPPVALLVQDTTEADVTRPAPEVAGAGARGGARRGFLRHALHAFTPEGTPLGTVAAEVLHRPAGVAHAPPPEKHRARHQAPSTGCCRAWRCTGSWPGARC